MKIILLHIVNGLLLFSVTINMVVAQSSNITGTVKSSQGQFLENAEITVNNLIFVSEKGYKMSTYKSLIL